jgi:glyoxylase-like metal-dependent hydrolase (beta-lactamase superfamily II)
VAVLASIGIATTDVTDVVITHRHVDHAGNLHRFPRAVLYIQNDERAALLAAASTSEAVRKRLKAKNVVAFDDAAAVADILTVRKIGGHTAGSCVVYLHAFDAACVLTGDECYLPANVTERNPVGTLVNEKANVAFIEDLYASGTRFFTFHDPALVPGPQKARRLL